jgi:arabinose-5-phosphate isomerase
VDDICHKGNDIPIVNEHITVREALLEVTSKKLGMTCVVNNEGFLTGIYTDGDIRRTLTEEKDITTTLLANVMSRHCQTIREGLLAAEALAIMQKHSITSLVMVDPNHRPTAVVHLHDLLRAGVI